MRIHYSGARRAGGDLRPLSESHQYHTRRTGKCICAMTNHGISISQCQALHGICLRFTIECDADDPIVYTASITNCMWVLNKRLIGVFKVRAIYSDYYITECGTLSFDQVPYFLVVERLALEKKQMLEDKQMWINELLGRQVRAERNWLEAYATSWKRGVFFWRHSTLQKA